MTNKKWLSNEDFDFIYGKVPRLNIDVIVRNGDQGIVLIKRAIEPNLGCFHLPGGTLYKGELVNDAAKRIALGETGFEVEIVRFVDYMEFPHEQRGDVLVHTVSIVMEVSVIGGQLRADANAREIGIFNELPSPCIKEHGACISKHAIL